jgi:hypothetical protein
LLSQNPPEARKQKLASLRSQLNADQTRNAALEAQLAAEQEKLIAENAVLAQLGNAFV